MQNGPRRRGRQLSPEEKWQVFVEVTSQQISQADAARKWGVDVSTVIKLQAAGQGRRAGGVRGLQAGAAAVGRAGRDRGAARGECAALGGAQGAGGGAVAAPGKAALGLFGPVPGRVSAETKLGLLGLVEHAVAGGWSHVRACEVLEVADVRVHRWRARLRDHRLARGPRAGRRRGAPHP